MSKRKKWRWAGQHKHGPGGRKKHVSERAAMLTPLEETGEFEASPQVEAGREARDDTIRVDSSAVKMPERLVEDERDAADTFRPAAVVVVIAALMLAFTAFVAWQITLMPAAK